MLYSLITDKQKLFCALIDFGKAFDTISHTFLWSKLLKYGVGNRFVTMMNSLYSHV